VHLGPLDYLGKIQFTQQNFPDIWLPIVVASIVFLIGSVVLYNVRVRQLHRHEVLRSMQEWLLWTGLVTWSMVLVAVVFNWYFLFVLTILLVGIATLVWIRFFRFPPYIVAYNEQLKRARFFSQSRYKAAEATVRTKRTRGTQRRRRS
jgi:hypothetical protein